MRARLHERDLGVEPRPAGRDLAGVRLLVDAPLAARLPLEVLDDVGDVDLRAVDPRLRERPIEQRAGRTDERMAAQILGVARLLADEHQRRRRRAFAEDGLRGALVEVACGAVLAAARTAASVGRSGMSSAASFGDVSASRRQDEILRSPGLSVVRERDREIATQPCHLRAAHRASPHGVPQLIVVIRRASVETLASVHAGRGCQAGSLERGGDLIPRTDFLADVAAVDVRADGRRELVGNRAALLDRQVRNAARRVEHAGRDERVRRTRLEAQRARAALIERRRVDLERQAADDLARERSTSRRRGLMTHVFLPIQPTPACCA